MRFSYNTVMPSLQVRDLPEDVYRQLVESARREHRSIAQQATYLLARALGREKSSKERRLKLLEHLRRNPLVETVEDLRPPEEMVREDRRR